MTDPQQPIDSYRIADKPVHVDLDDWKTALADRYAIQSEIGSGGMATVYLAEDLKHHRQVAVKVLKREISGALGTQRFLREIEIAARLSHPHILPLYDSGKADGFLYYVMPYVEGDSLRTKLAREGKLGIDETVRILREVADALAHAHAHGVVHRDIKPDNVMLSGRHAMVADFGVAKALSASTPGDANLTGIGAPLGTPTYMSPEQASGSPNVDRRADIYALGVLAYEMLTGNPPFVDPDPRVVVMSHVSRTPAPVAGKRPDTPAFLAELVMRCLEKRREDRWQQAAEVAQRLEGGTTASGGLSAVAPGWGRRGAPHRIVAIYGITAVVITGIVYAITMLLGLPNWVVAAAIVLLAAGVPIVVATGRVERRRALRGSGASLAETGLARWATWPNAVAGGVVAFTGLACAAGVYMALRLLGIGPVGTLVAAGVLEERDRIIVAEFENRTGDSLLGPAVTEAFRVDLAQSPIVTLLQPGYVAQVLRRMERDPGTPLDLPLAREVAVREGVKAVVGRVEHRGSRLRTVCPARDGRFG